MKNKTLTLLLTLLPFFGMAQWGLSTDSLGNLSAFRIDTVFAFKKPDTTYGVILVQTCQQCQPIYRPIISIKKSMWDSGTHQVRYWRRQWLFGKIQYFYKPIPASWKLIDYKRMASWK